MASQRNFIDGSFETSLKVIEQNALDTGGHPRGFPVVRLHNLSTAAFKQQVDSGV